MDHRIKIHKVFKETRKHFKACKDVIIHKGGTGSGKTFEIMLFLLFSYAMKQNSKVITIVSESVPHLKIGTKRYLDNFLLHYNLFGSVTINKSDSTYIINTGTVIEFFSTDRIDKALGARRDVLFGNEINSIKKDVWEELARRSKLIIADFNPTSQFWLEDWIRFYDNSVIIKSNYLDNKSLPEHERERIKKRAELDSNFKRIHIDCEYGIYEGLVFADWLQVDEMPDCKSVKFGLDFGYTNDPACLVKVGITGNDIYIDELIYKTNLQNRELINLMNSFGIRKRYDEIIADSAEPKSIDEIAMAGYNCKPAVKGRDSINYGIDKLKSMNIHVTKRSVNLIKELRNYSWENDKNGNPTNKPVDMHNHAIDAIRYAISTKKDLLPLQLPKKIKMI